MTNQEKFIEYVSDAGYKGVLYGESSFAIYDENGKECLHTGHRSFNTFERLKEIVDVYPEFEHRLEELFDNLDDEDFDDI